MMQWRRAGVLKVVLVAVLVAFATACTNQPTSVPAAPTDAIPTRTPATTDPPESPKPHQSDATTIASATTIDFVDPAVGFLGGTRAMWATSDGGSTWRRVWKGVGDVVALDAVDPLHVWASIAQQSGKNARLLVTSDGGQSWHQQGRSTLFGQIAMVSPTVGWAIGGTTPASADGEPFLVEPATVVRTTDGGATWRETGATAQSVCAVDAEVAWLASGSIAERTLDGGATWTTTRLYPRGSFSTAAIGCSDASSAWDLAVGDGAMSQQPYIASETTDGGATWTPVLHEAYFPPPSGVSGFRDQIDAYSGPFAVPSAEEVFFAGSSPAEGTISVTGSTDAGMTFHHVRLGPARERHLESPLAVSFADPHHGWLLIGENRATQSHLWRTTDGRSWDRIPLRTRHETG